MSSYTLEPDPSEGAGKKQVLLVYVQLNADVTAGVDRVVSTAAERLSRVARLERLLEGTDASAARARGDWLSPGAQPAWLDAAIEKALAACNATAPDASAGSPAPRVTPEKPDAPAQRSAFLRPPPTMQRWDVGMRQALSVDVSKLPPECLNDVVKIV